MTQLTSARLELIALSYEQLIQLQQGFAALQQQMGLAVTGFELSSDDGFLQQFFEVQESQIIPAVKNHPDAYEWYSLWLIVDRGSRSVAGGIGLSGLPDEQGQVEVGYFIDKHFEGKGYATGALQLLSSWVFEHPDVACILAHTLKNGFASQRVLQKSGFERAGETEQELSWKLPRRR